MTKKYSKSELLKIIIKQQENINTMQEFLKLVTHQNEFLNNLNNKLKNEIVDLKHKRNSK